MNTGTLYKENDKWWVKYLATGNVSSSNKPMIASFWVKLPLHPDDVAVFNELEERFDNLEARINANPEVIFEEVELLPPNGNYMEPNYFAKLIKNENNEK
jgi:hypothetical protein